jgi:hypothetical protein
MNIAMVLGVVGGQNMWVQFCCAPLLMGFVMMDGKKPSDLPSSVQTPEDFVDDRKIEFGRMLEACAAPLQSLLDYPAGVTNEQFFEFQSLALLSPIFYPPKVPGEKELTDRIYRRLEAQVLMDQGSVFLGDDIQSIADIKFADDLASIDFDAEAEFYAKTLPATLAIRGLRYTQAERDLYHPIAQELSRPGPFDFPLPTWVEQYKKSILPFLFLGVRLDRLPPQAMRAILPKMHLDFSNVPA